MTIEKINIAPAAAAPAHIAEREGKLGPRQVSHLEKALKVAAVVGAVVLGIAALAALVSSAVVFFFPAVTVSGSIAAGLAAAGAGLGTGVSALAGLVTQYPLYAAIAGAVGLAVIALSSGGYALINHIRGKDDSSEEAVAAKAPAVKEPSDELAAI